MSDSTTKTQETTATDTETVQNEATTTTETNATHVLAIRRVVVNPPHNSNRTAALPVIEVGHPIYANCVGQARRNMKGFFETLPIGGIFTVPDMKSVRTFHSAATYYNKKISSRKMEGGTYRCQRVA